MRVVIFEIGYRVENGTHVRPYVLLKPKKNLQNKHGDTVAIQISQRANQLLASRCFGCCLVQLRDIFGNKELPLQELVKVQPDICQENGSRNCLRERRHDGLKPHKVRSNVLMQLE